MSLDKLPTDHLRVLLDGLAVFEQHGLVLAGGYALRAHDMLDRPSQDLDFATSGVSVFQDEDFADYGLDEATITDLRVWVTGWYDDLSRRIPAEIDDAGV